MIAVMNQKGGVGKTTTTMNLSHALAQTGQRVLAIDLDPQAHLTAGFGLVRKSQPGMAELMLGEKSADEVVVLARDNMDLLPAGDRLGELEHLTDGGSKRGWLLRDALKGFSDDYDYILVDCPPSSGILGMNALLAAKEVLIPVSGDFFALQGLARLMGIFQHIETSLKLKTEKWVVLTRFQERRRLAKDVRDKIMSYFPKRVYRTAIREAVALAESPGFGQTIFEYQASSNGAKDYKELAKDILKGKAMH